MKTEVIMKRELFGSEISQLSKRGFFSATDLISAGNKWRVENGKPIFNQSVFFQNSSTKEFVQELEKRFGEVKINSRGKNSHTWVHPLLFIDIALAISPALKVEVYQWLYDHLLQYRNDSGDSFKKMSGALYLKVGNKREFPNLITKVSTFIRDKVVKVPSWEDATEEQLALRDRIHENIALLVDVIPIDDAIRIGIKKATEDTK